MADNSSFNKLVPGFEFLQSLVKNAGSALPNIGHWVAPTLNPEEIGKRIEELRTVKFWLEQNGRMLDATIQALEVQKMTLSTLKTMNVQMDDLRESMKIRPMSSGTPASAEPHGSSSAGAAQNPAIAAAAAFANAFQFPRGSTPAASTPAPGATADTASRAGDAGSGQTHTAADASARPGAPEPRSEPPAGAIDPMQWWNALTKQFTTLATSALQESSPARASDGSSGSAGSARQRPASAPRAQPKRAPAAASRTAEPASKKAPRKSVPR